MIESTVLSICREFSAAADDLDAYGKAFVITPVSRDGGSEWLSGLVQAGSNIAAALSPRPSVSRARPLIRWMDVTDANLAGFVHGGTVMRLCDEAAAIAASKHE